MTRSLIFESRGRQLVDMLAGDLSDSEYELPEMLKVNSCRIHNTFVDTCEQRSPSLERFYTQREVRSCPSYKVGRLKNAFRDELSLDGDGDEVGSASVGSCAEHASQAASQRSTNASEGSTKQGGGPGSVEADGSVGSSSGVPSPTFKNDRAIISLSGALPDFTPSASTSVPSTGVDMAGYFDQFSDYGMMMPMLDASYMVEQFGQSGLGDWSYYGDGFSQDVYPFGWPAPCGATKASDAAECKDKVPSNVGEEDIADGAPAAEGVDAEREDLAQKSGGDGAAVAVLAEAGEERRRRRAGRVKGSDAEKDGHWQKSGEAAVDQASSAESHEERRVRRAGGRIRGPDLEKEAPEQKGRGGATFEAAASAETYQERRGRRVGGRVRGADAEMYDHQQRSRSDVAADCSGTVIAGDERRGRRVGGRIRGSGAETEDPQQKSGADVAADAAGTVDPLEERRGRRAGGRIRGQDVEKDDQQKSGGDVAADVVQPEHAPKDPTAAEPKGKAKKSKAKKGTKGVSNSAETGTDVNETATMKYAGGMGDAMLSAEFAYSAGSASHGSGLCRPCAFYHAQKCNNGDQCTYCHMCDMDERKKRRREKQEGQRRERMVQHRSP